MNKERLKRLEISEQENFYRVCVRLHDQRQIFLIRLESHFEPFIKSGREQSQFDWTCLKRYYNKYKDDLKNFLKLRVFCSFVLKLFFTFECQDNQFVMKIIQMYHQVMEECETKFGLCDNCMEVNNPRHYIYEDLECSQFILKSINKVKNNYMFTNREFYSILTIEAVYTGDYNLLQFLVKYGLNCFPDDVLNAAVIALYQLNIVCCEWRLIEVTDEAKQGFKESVLKQLYDVSANPNLKRTILTVMAVITTISKAFLNSYYKDYAHCLRLYSLTVPEPEISHKDVECFLELAFPNDTDLITEMYSNFKEVFPESPSLPSPRPLKFLCRCKVRDCVEKLPTLTAVLSQLQIPTTVKDYLLIS